MAPRARLHFSTNNNQKAKFFPFFLNTSDTAEIEFTDSTMRVWVNETPIVRSQVGTVIPPFSAWTISIASGGTVGVGPPLTSNSNPVGTISKAIGTVSVAPQDIGIEHGLRIVVGRGPVNFKIGSSPGAYDIFEEITVDDGVFSLGFIPNVSTFYIQIEFGDIGGREIDSVSIEPAGIMTLPTPWAVDDLPYIRVDNSADVLYFTRQDTQPHVVERFGARSWSIVRFKSTDGPFPSAAGGRDVLITPSALVGDVTLTSNLPIFDPLHVNSLIRLFHNGQFVYSRLASSDTYSNAIEVTGVSKYDPPGGGASVATNDRTFYIVVSGVYSGTLTLQRSFLSADAGFTDYVSSPAGSIADDLDNVIVWYRVGFKAGAYGSGYADVRISYGGGGGPGVARIFQWNSSTSVQAEVLVPFYNTTTASDYRFSEWSDFAGWPGAVAFFEGRLWFAGNNRLIGSVPNVYTSFSFDTPTGDSATIDRSLGSGAVVNANWLMALTRLLMGCDSAVVSARSTSFDELLTPTTINIKPSCTLGCAQIAPIKLDIKGIFVDASGRRVYELSYGGGSGGGFTFSLIDYAATELTRLNEDIGKPQLLASAIQRQPDTRLHFVRGDGQVAILTFDEQDDVVAWWRWTAPNAFVEDVIVQPSLPGTLEDRVYYCIRRVINGQTVRSWERWTRFDECEGGTISKIADCHSIYQGNPTTVLTGLGYLEGQNVIVWADGKDLALDQGVDVSQTGGVTPWTVTNGQITLPIPVSNAVVGLYYNGTFKSAKLAFAAKNGAALNRPKRVDHLGVVLGTAHALGFYHSPNGTVWDQMPVMDDGQATSQDKIWVHYDKKQFEFNGEWDSDSRLWFRCHAPRPCTVEGLTFSINTSG